ncbi:hypothetical protein C9374_011251 [Naegleria lovaniensis]|uniref:Uncharacterized protein n=1 Tax=Naegleria lovaniensis TaxID=51637 RepID=A0AA88KQJ4_NAELO|nr:uncharacterized protein C9374_011251 [Naegleria lovaniensis]KAG2392526.1 hypothetical protein C9374_011251 [Naegleria lovaniensis]
MITSTKKKKYTDQIGVAIDMGNSQIKVAMAIPTSKDYDEMDFQELVQILPINELLEDSPNQVGLNSNDSKFISSFSMPNVIAFPGLEEGTFTADATTDFEPNTFLKSFIIGDQVLQHEFFSQSQTNSSTQQVNVTPPLNPHHIIYDLKKFFLPSTAPSSNDANNETSCSSSTWTFNVIPSISSKLELPRIQIHSKTFTPPEILSRVYSRIHTLLDKYLQQQQEEPIHNPELRLILSIWSCCTERQAWKDSATISGFNVMRCMNESTCACLAYGLHQLSEISRILVLDWGSDFKCSDMMSEDYILEILNSASYSEFGGEAIVNLLMEKCQERMQKEWKRNSIHEDPRAFLRLRNACEQAIIELSNKETNSEINKTGDNERTTSLHTIRLNNLMHGLDFEWTLSSSDFEDILIHSQLIDKALFKVQQFIQSTPGFTQTDHPNTFRHVVLCGGCMQIAAVKKKVLEFLSNNSNFHPLSTIHDSIHPQQVVVRGAMIQSLMLTSPKRSRDFNCLISYILPLSIGVEASNGLMQVVIPRNTCYPCRKQSILQQVQVQEGNVIRIRVFEGERVMCRDNHELGQVVLENIPALVGDKIDVTISMCHDLDDNLEVTAHALGIQKSLHINEQSTRLSEEEIYEMVELAEKLKADDEILKQKLQAQHALEQCVFEMRQFLETLNQHDEQQQVTEENRTAVKMACAQAVAFIANHPEASKAEIEHAQQQFQEQCKTLVQQYPFVRPSNNSEQQRPTTKPTFDLDVD